LIDFLFFILFYFITLPRDYFYFHFKQCEIRSVATIRDRLRAWRSAGITRCTAHRSMSENWLAGHLDPLVPLSKKKEREREKKSATHVPLSSDERADG